MVYDPSEWNHKDPTRFERALDLVGDVFRSAHPNYWGLLGLTLVLAGCGAWL